MRKPIYKLALITAILILLIIPAPTSLNQGVIYPGYLVRKMIEETMINTNPPKVAETKEEEGIRKKPFDPELLGTQDRQEETTSTEPENNIDNYNLTMAFTSQAPTGNWDLPFQEACEEAALIIGANFYGLEPNIDNPEIAEERIVKLVDYIAESGLAIDLTLEELKKVYEEYYQRDAEIIYDYDLDFIKAELLKNHPIIMPFAGRELGNPYYTQPGPVYHFLVIKGFENGDIITHDPGTRRGADYAYPYNIIRFANHDWNNADVENGQKGLLVLY